MRRFARSRSMPRSRRKRTRRSARVIVHGMLRWKGSCHRSHADFIRRVLIHCQVCAERVTFFEFSLQEKGICMEMEIPQLVAHRGYPRRYPENTLESIAAAIHAGACYVEFDVQVTADGIPVLEHNKNHKHTTNTHKHIVNTKQEKHTKHTTNEPKRFGTRHRNLTIPTLAATVDLLKQHPRVTPFVELKKESLEAHGREKVVKNVLAILEPLKSRYVIISYDALSLRTARAMGARCAA